MKTSVAGAEIVDDVPALEVEALRGVYGTTEVVRGLDLFVARGEIVTLVGPSGCGKTTTLRLVAGLEKPASGEVRIAGRPVAGRRYVPAEERHVGLMFQDFALFPHLTILENVVFGVRDRPAAQRRAVGLRHLADVGLERYADAFPYVLSGGQQQRVALARALAPSPALMLLDEPFSGLDTHLRQQIRAETVRMLQDRGAATMMVTHDPEEALFMSDRIAVMDDGRIVQLGTPSDVYFRPASAFVARFFGEINTFVGRVAGGRVAVPLGEIAAPGHREGAAVEVMVRPEHIHVGGGEGVEGTVVLARMLGRTSLLRVKLGTGSAASEVVVRASPQFLPRVGEHIYLTLGPEQPFVFPVGAA